MTKNTSVSASATFDQIPSPNHSRNNGASTTRGTAFNILIYGSNTRASTGDRPSRKPSEMPAAAPSTRPSSDSSRVAARCRHSDPSITQIAIRCAMAVGRLTKNGSRSFSETRPCHSDSAQRPTAICQNAIVVRLASRASGSPTRRLGGPLAPDYFLAEHDPERAVEIDECGRRAQFHQVTGAIERHGLASHDVCGRAGGQHDDLVGERDRLFEIVRHEDDGFPIAARLKGSPSGFPVAARLRGLPSGFLEREAFRIR